MVSIVTYQASMLVQKNLDKSTDILNQSIERMTTGFKINGAKDNAADYSISQNMSSKIASYQVAEDNAMMGLDLVETANAGLDQMTYLTNRLRDLAVQAQNGSYGQESLDAINAEARSLMDELERIKANTEYNGINLLESKGNVVSYMQETYFPSGAVGIQPASCTNIYLYSRSASNASAAYVGGASDASGASGASGSSGVSSYYFEYKTDTDRDGNSTYHLTNGFICNYASGASGASGSGSNGEYLVKAGLEHDDRTVSNKFISNPSGVENPSGIEIGHQYYSSNDTYVISSKEDLIELRNMLNFVDISSNTFILGADIDLSGEEWTPIGDSEHAFNGIFDGNGHKITGLQAGASSNAGLFGNVSGGTIKNLGIEGASVGANCDAGILAGRVSNCNITNCYVEGEVTGDSSSIGGMIGKAEISYITDCSAKVDVTGSDSIGGLVGRADSVSILNCHTDGNVTTSYNSYYVGGLVGYANSGTVVAQSSSTANVAGYAYAGGLVGRSEGAIYNSSATGTVSGVDHIGGLVGSSSSSIYNSCASGSVSGINCIGGLAGGACTIQNCYATGNVTGNQGYDIGGLAGSCADGNIKGCYATGKVIGNNCNYIGGLVGDFHSNYEISNCFATGSVTGSSNGSNSSYGNYVGGLVGITNNEVRNCYATGTVTGIANVGGLAGCTSLNISNSYTTGNVNGDDHVGGIAGLANNNISTSYSLGNVNGTGEEIGGIVGRANSIYIQNSYSLNKISGSKKVAGAIIGANTGSSVIENCVYSDAINTVSVIVGTNISPTITNVTNATIPKFEFECTLQVGIKGDSASQISFTSSAPKTSLDTIRTDGIEKAGTIDLLDEYLNELLNSQTSLGAVENRLMSAVESIGISYNNLVSSRSTLRDADIAKESSNYIKAQILQQAAATLLATANQNPSIALQLI